MTNESPVELGAPPLGSGVLPKSRLRRYSPSLSSATDDRLRTLRARCAGGLFLLRRLALRCRIIFRSRLGELHRVAGGEGVFEGVVDRVLLRRRRFLLRLLFFV